MPERKEKMKVAVCVITYLRPGGLKRLMEGLNELTFDKCGEALSLELIVIDNDPSGLACAFCKQIQSDLRWPLRCFVEPRRGIPFARNTAVARALEEGAEFIAFIDDDEVPEPSWLDELLHAQRTYGADVVTGPALPHFAIPVAPWIEKGGFFEHPRYPTGQPMEYAATSNVLVRSEVFEKMGRLFDERFALTGGTDRLFFARVHRAGYEIVWADNALVYEWMPKSRTNMRWLTKRSCRYGNGYILRVPDSEISIAARAGLAAKAGKMIAKGSVLLLLRLPRSLKVKRRPLIQIRKLRSPIAKRPQKLGKPLLKISFGVGMLLGVVGKRYEEYKRTHSV